MPFPRVTLNVDVRFRALGPKALGKGVLSALCAFLMAGSLTRESARAADLSDVTVGVLGASATMWPVYIAQNRGFFRDVGIKVDLIQTGSSAASAQQTAAGSLDIGNSSTFDAFRAIDAGADLKIFLSSQAGATHMLFASKSIKSYADLKGKRVITGGAKDITTLWWNAAARHFGLDPKNDVELIYSGATSARYAALVGGAVDGAVLASPQTFDAEDNHYVNLGLVGPYLGDFPTNVWYANMKWGKAHSAEMLAFVKGNNRGVGFFLDRKNRDAASKILADVTHLKIDVALRTYDLCLQAHAFLPDGTISVAALERVRNLLDQTGDLQKPVKPISAFYDGSYIKAAEAAKP